MPNNSSVSKNVLHRVMYDNLEYDVFRSEMAHTYHFLGDYNFIKSVMEIDLVNFFFYKKEYVKSLYTLAMIDYISWKNKVPQFEGYEKLRKCKLESIIYPPEVIMMDKIENSHQNRDEAVQLCKNDECGAFFFRHNIIEKSIDDVV